MVLVVLAGVIGTLLRSVALRFSFPTTESSEPYAFRWVPLLVGSFAFQALVNGKVSVHMRGQLTVASTALALLWMLANIRVTSNTSLARALWFFAFGAALNLVPIMKFGAMPVDINALRSVGISVSSTTEGHLSKHIAMQTESMPLLGDRFAIVPLRLVASLGDGVEMMGAVLLAFSRPSKRRVRTNSGFPIAA